MNQILELTTATKSTGGITLNSDNRKINNDVNKENGESFSEAFKKAVETKMGEPIDEQSFQDGCNNKGGAPVPPLVKNMEQHLSEPITYKLSDYNQLTPAINQNNLLNEEISVCKELGAKLATQTLGSPSEALNRGIEKLGDIKIELDIAETIKSKVKSYNADPSQQKGIASINTESASSNLSDVETTTDSFKNANANKFIESLNNFSDNNLSEVKNDKPVVKNNFPINASNLKNELNKILNSEADKVEIGSKKELKITVRPTYLGEIKIDMQRNSEGLKILIVASNENVSNLLTQHKSDILAEAERFLGDGGTSDEHNDKDTHSEYTEVNYESDKEQDDNSVIETELTITSNFTYH